MQPKENLSQQPNKPATKGLAHIFQSLKYSIDGLKAAYSECSIRQLLIFHTILMVLIFVLPFSTSVRMILVMASFISLIVELFNTAIEAAVDHTSLERHPLAKRAKDTGSSAQLVAIVLIIILWVMALWQQFLH
ncbi:diacylglycerol kinase [Snodgrassella sp. B3882]|uniref:diacylglycerol kinase n=1 Tax=Snodgrassella sp. B3882 TaxID=2818037 RepID=UPI00226A4FC2|nr:diacylglycerol kinase [Snodgrassella sp. B3882]MCX8744646.1 diacylglycerol kinase [Snodgrassella sp. B3882]